MSNRVLNSWLEVMVSMRTFSEDEGKKCKSTSMLAAIHYNEKLLWYSTMKSHGSYSRVKNGTLGSPLQH